MVFVVKFFNITSFWSKSAVYNIFIQLNETIDKYNIYAQDGSLVFLDESKMKFRFIYNVILFENSSLQVDIIWLVICF